MAIDRALVARVVLPFPGKDLSQNSRAHWTKRKDATADARAEAFMATKEALPLTFMGITKGTPLRVDMVFRKGTGHHYDLLNLAGRMKAAIDGVFDALGVDDESIVEASAKWGDRLSGGAVEMSVWTVDHE